MSITAAPKLSAVSPCYNEMESLAELYRRLTAACAAEVGDDYEIVLIDDGSSDATRSMITELCNRDPHVVGVLLSRNHGHQLALSAGLHICRGERILIIDADLQDPPELIGPMMKLMDGGADVVYGQRRARQGESIFKQFSAFAFYRLLNTMIDIKIPIDVGDFRLMSRRTVDELNRMPERYRFIRGMVSWIGFRQVPLQYDRHERFAGDTKYPLGKMLRFAVDAISGFSTLPLRMATYLGFLCSIMGMFFFAYTVYSYFTGIAIQGWTTLMTVVLILGSGQLLVLGVMGEYLGRLYIQSKNRPLFIIEDVIRAPATTSSHDMPLNAIRD
ncbi:MAG: glycosyltransferase family 2 protein [Pirellulales bacterium]|nr:glycosyltransferase family 2 protein [Pirellulales bacterium]